MSWLDKPSYRDVEGSQEPIEDPIEWYEGSLEAVPRALGEAGLTLGELSAMATAGVLETLGDEDADVYWKKYEQRRDWRKSLGENRRGIAADVVGGVAKYATLLATNKPAGVAAIFSSEAGEEISKGRSLADAEKLATIRAGTLYAGASITASLAPKYGLGATLGYGASTNAGLGIASRTLEKQVIGEEAGPIFDPTAIVIDVALGSVFGAREYRLNKRIIDAALDARATTKAQDSAPGKPSNGEQLDMHMQAVADATKATETGLDPDYSRLDIGEVDPRMAARMNDTIKILDNEVSGQKAEYNLEEIELTPEQMAAFKAQIGIQDATTRPELHAFKDMDTIGGGKPEQSWTENTRVIGADKAPATIYRGSQDGETRVEDFGEARIGGATGHPSSGLGVWFSGSKSDAAEYGKVGEYHLDLRNPKIYSIEDFPGFDTIQESKALRQELIKQGHDGVVIDARNVGGPVQFVAFKPESVIKAKPIEQPKQRAETPNRGVSKQSEQGISGRPEEGRPAVREEIPDEITVVTQDGEAVTGADYAKQLEAETKQIDDIIGKIQSVTECLLRNANV